MAPDLPRNHYDLLVIGGGIYGLCLALESAQRGLRTAVIERDRFGGATSANTLRIIHGGLRYLQTLDLPRFRDSVGERHWFLREFPEFVRPRGFLMPLYGRGMKRKSLLRCAFGLNNLLSLDRNRKMPPEQRIPAARVVNRKETKNLFPDVCQHGLTGAALWYDGFMVDWEAVVQSILQRARSRGADCRCFVEATDLILADNKITGVRARCLETGASLVLQAGVVVNCTGPWCRTLAAHLDRDIPELFQPSLAFNLLLDRKPLSSIGLALSPAANHNKTYFLVAEGDRLLAGTFHTRYEQGALPAVPSDEQTGRFLEDLNRTLPQLNLSLSEVLRVDAGVLPARRAGSAEPRSRPVIVDHLKHGGPAGLYSVSGVKFTTARSVAARTLDRIRPALPC